MKEIANLWLWLSSSNFKWQLSLQMVSYLHGSVIHVGASSATPSTSKRTASEAFEGSPTSEGYLFTFFENAKYFCKFGTIIFTVEQLP